MEISNENILVEINRIFRYIIAGFIITFINTGIDLISHIASLFSGLLFYLAIRQLRSINRSFKIANYLSLIFLIVNMFNMVLHATPYENVFFETAIIFIGLIRVLFMIRGFYNFLEDKYHIKRILIFYLINLLIEIFAYLLGMNTSLLLNIVVIVFFVLMICHFRMMKDIFEINNLGLANVKISSIKLGIGYSLVTIILCLIMTFISVTTYYHYEANKDWIKFNFDEALDYKKTISYDENGQEFAKIEVFLFKNDNRYCNYIIVSDLKEAIYYQELEVRLVDTGIIHDYYNYEIAYQNPLNNKIYQTTSSIKHREDLFISEDITIHKTYFGSNNLKKCIILVEYTVLDKSSSIYVNMDNEIIPSYPFKNKNFESSNSFLITIKDDKLDIS